MSDRRTIRARMDALDAAVQGIEAAFGTIGDQIMGGTGLLPEIRLENCIMHGFPEDTLANDVVLAPWEVLTVIETLRDAYRDQALAPSEREVA